MNPGRKRLRKVDLEPLEQDGVGFAFLLVERVELCLFVANVLGRILILTHDEFAFRTFRLELGNRPSEQLKNNCRGFVCRL